YETELPDLGLLQFELYPLGLRGDLSDVVVVVPDEPGEEILPALLELAVAFARLAPAPHLAFRVRRLAELTRDELAESHLMILAPERRRDPLAQLLPGWMPPGRRASVDGHAIVRELASPWNPQKYVVIIGAAPGRLQRAVSVALSEPGLSQLRGDVAYLSDGRLETLTLGPRRRVGERSYLIFVEAWLRAHWLALPIILITVSALLFVGVRLGLRRYRRDAEWIPLDGPG
ncbi:MAG: cellulose biosynthesis cyclic di-GMP-binding regulatory protein BcsB, partial [Candidatus Rokuibacteriota bacterium]